MYLAFTQMYNTENTAALPKLLYFYNNLHPPTVVFSVLTSCNNNTAKTPILNPHGFTPMGLETTTRRKKNSCAKKVATALPIFNNNRSCGDHCMARAIRGFQQQNPVHHGCINCANAVTTKTRSKGTYIITREVSVHHNQVKIRSSQKLPKTLPLNDFTDISNAQPTIGGRLAFFEQNAKTVKI